MSASATGRLQEHTGQPAESLFVICSVSGLGLMIMAFLWFSGHGPLLRIAFPGVATLVGLVIYLKNAPWYVIYTLSLWFLSPLVRRIVDWHFGFAEPNFVLLAPLLVSGIGLLTLLRAPRSIPTPFVLCASGILYAVALDILRRPSPETVYGMANWLCPMMFGLHLYLNSDSYEHLRSIITKTFLVAVPILGLYGIYQFIAPPVWDTNWLTNVSLTDLNPSFGQPEPFQIRVWSTMNTPGPFEYHDGRIAFADRCAVAVENSCCGCGLSVLFVVGCSFGLAKLGCRAGTDLEEPQPARNRKDCDVTHASERMYAAAAERSHYRQCGR